ncbi:MAG: alkaline phosphatase family protein [Candidatus Helarchaeota archaeon]
MNLFFIILDGCSHKALQLASTPFLDNISSFTVMANAVLPTATYTGHSSIMTGTPPNTHGIIGNVFLDRTENRIKDFDDHDVNEYLLCPTAFEHLGALPGAAICEPVTRGAKYIKAMNEINQQPGEMRDEIVFKDLLHALKKPALKLFVANFSGIDYMGENYGERSSRYLEEISIVDDYLKEIYKRSNENSLFLITADHGMTSARENLDLQSLFLNEGIKDVICLATHRASHVYARERDLERMTRILAKNEKIDVILSKEEISARNLNHERCGDIVVFAKKGYELSNHEMVGSHGGLDNLEREVPILVFDKNINEKIRFDEMRSNYSIMDLLPTALKILKHEVPSFLCGKSLIL